MSSLSVCLIVRDEELVLDRCLSAAKQFADEIIVVDTGSTDNTINIAKRYTNNVYTLIWQDDFAYARNASFDYATCDYILWLDADDVVTPDNIYKINNLKQTMSADMYMCKYQVGFNGDEVTYSFYRERIVRRACHYKWHGCVHECITPSGVVEYTDIAIQHRKLKDGDNKRNIGIYEKVKKLRALDARETYYYARELYYNHKYKQCIKYMKQFFGMNGFVENVIDGHIIVADCYIMLGSATKAMHELYITFDYDMPRANVCCKLGDIFMGYNKYNIAIYWYNAATICTHVDKKGGFVQDECYGYYPYIQMCVAYYNLGDIHNAILCNDMAAKYRPNDSAVKNNKKFFDNLVH